MKKGMMVLLAAIVAPTLVYAQADQAPPPPPPMGGPGGGMPGGFGGPGGMMPPGMQMQMEKMPYLGVEASNADPALAAQMKLPGGAGLVVNFVAGDSPAKLAGLERFDLITKVDDQMLFNPPQLQALIRGKKAGDEVKLTVIRGGETKTVTAKLTEREMPTFGPMGMPPGMMPGMGWGGAMGGAGFAPPMGAGSTLMIGDGKTRLELKNRSGEVTLTATVEKGPGERGEELFEGPIETREQRAKLPENVRLMLGDALLDHLVARLKNAPIPGGDEGRGGRGGRPQWGPGPGQGGGPGHGPGGPGGPGPGPAR